MHFQIRIQKLKLTALGLCFDVRSNPVTLPRIDQNHYRQQKLDFDLVWNFQTHVFSKISGFGCTSNPERFLLASSSSGKKTFFFLSHFSPQKATVHTSVRSYLTSREILEKKSALLVQQQLKALHPLDQHWFFRSLRFLAIWSLSPRVDRRYHKCRLIRFGCLVFYPTKRRCIVFTLYSPKSREGIIVYYSWMFFEYVTSD